MDSRVTRGMTMRNHCLYVCYSRTETQAGEVCEKGIMLSRYRMGALYPKHRTIFLAKEGLCFIISFCSFYIIFTFNKVLGYNYRVVWVG